MKDILKMINFDFCNIKSFLAAGSVLTFVFVILGIFISPVICSYTTFIMAALVIVPLQNISNKTDFKKLYGIIPINRKNIVRARFLFIFLVFFITEIIESVFAFISYKLRLPLNMSVKYNETTEFLKDSFNDPSFIIIAIVAIFVIVCLMFTFTEMVGQIFGRENEFKLILITLSVITILAVGFFWLSDHNIIPTIKLNLNISKTTFSKIMIGIIVNAALLGINLLFGEITANKLAKREL